MYIFSNDPVTPATHVSLLYQVMTDSPFDRQHISFGRVDYSELPLTRRVFFREENQQDIPVRQDG